MAKAAPKKPAKPAAKAAKRAGRPAAVKAGAMKPAKTAKAKAVKAKAPVKKPAAVKPPVISKDELRAQLEKALTTIATLRAKSRDAVRAAKISTARIAELEATVEQLEKKLAAQAKPAKPAKAARPAKPAAPAKPRRAKAAVKAEAAPADAEAENEALLDDTPLDDAPDAALPEPETATAEEDNAGGGTEDEM